MGALAIQTRSQPGAMCGRRNLAASRSSLLARLRWTALPTFLLVMNPQRVMFSLLRAAFNTISPEPQVRPSRFTRSNCAALLSRSKLFAVPGSRTICSRFAA